DDDGGGDDDGGNHHFMAMSDDPPPPIINFKLNLSDLYGTGAQLAIDNFVVGDSPIPNDPLDRPLVYRPHAPVGRNTPVYLSKQPIEEVDPENLLDWDAIDDAIEFVIDVHQPDPDFGGGTTNSVGVTVLPGSPLHDATMISVEDK